MASIPSASTDMVFTGEPVTASPGGRGVFGGCGFGLSGGRGVGGTRVSVPQSGFSDPGGQLPPGVSDVTTLRSRWSPLAGDFTVTA